MHSLEHHASYKRNQPACVAWCNPLFRDGCDWLFIPSIMLCQRFATATSLHTVEPERSNLAGSFPARRRESGDVRRGDEGPYVCTIQLPESSTRLTQTTILSVVERLNGELTVKPRPIVPPDCVDSSQDTCRRLAGLGHCEFNDVKRRCCRSCWESENN
eukprot:m.32952 g.32952  ORF g.32952 m.32952 type:complete len:159 (+) comp31728_c0_seq7:2141-2617(+)